jgi:hypothetical protein
MTERQELLRVESIDYDTENPRIKKALEKYGDKLNAERIHFALRSASDGERGTSSFVGLRDSIRACRGIQSPIVVTANGDRYNCVDGNTRLAIYRQFLKEQPEDRWGKIKAIVLENASQVDIEKIRVAAHMVGAREWPAYEKARYLHYLRNQEFMDFSEMVALCGGNKRDIERQIDAYHDMNEYYRDVVDDTAFHIDRFSGFVELQKPGIKDAIFDAGLELTDFGKWIRDGNIYRLADVRQLPKVLADDEAQEIFLSGGPRSIEKAVKRLEQKTEPAPAKRTTLEAASLYQLAQVLARRLNDLPYSEVRVLKNKESPDAADQLRALEDLSEQLQAFLQDVRE